VCVCVYMQDTHSFSKEHMHSEPCRLFFHEMFFGTLKTASERRIVAYTPWLTH
jgi:hypothetical protein